VRGVVYQLIKPLKVVRTAEVKSQSEESKPEPKPETSPTIDFSLSKAPIQTAEKREIKVPGIAKMFGVDPKIIEAGMKKAQEYEERLNRIEATIQQWQPVFDKLANLLSKIPDNLPSPEEMAKMVQGGAANPQTIGFLGDIIRLGQTLFGEGNPLEKLVYSLLQSQIQTSMLLNRALINSLVKKGLLSPEDLTGGLSE